MLTAWDLQAITGPRPTGLGYSVRLLFDAFTQFGGEDGGPETVIGLRPNATDRALRGVPDRLLWEQWRLPRTVPRFCRSDGAAAGGVPALLYCPALGAPLRCALPRVAHVHDLIPLADPSQFSGLARWYWTRYLPDCWKRCAALTVSNASLVAEVEQRLSLPRSRVHVVPYYTDAATQCTAVPDAVDSSQAAATPYFLTLASHEPRKNIELAIEALSLLAQRGQRPRLICAGGHTVHTARLQALAERLGVSRQLVWPGYTERKAALGLLKGAVALLFVSRLEGYGMPPQEAQALGTPVVLSDIPCHRAVYDDSQRWSQVTAAGQARPPFVDTNDAAALAELMSRLLEDSDWRQQLSVSGKAYQRSFSPQASAAALASAFRSAVA